MAPTDETQTVVEPTAPAADAPQKVNGLFYTLYGLMIFGQFLLVMMPALFSLPYKIQLLAPDDKALTLGIVATVGAIVSIVVGPVAGVLSDHTTSRWGRRRPWLFGGIVVALVGSILVAIAPSVPLLIGAWVVVCVGGAGTTAATAPIVAERVPEAQRGTAAAIGGVATQLGGVMGYTIGGMLTGNLVLLFALPVVVLAVFALIYSLKFPDSVAPAEHVGIRETFASLVFNPRKHPDFSLVWLGKLLMQTALAFLTTYQLYYLSDRLGFTAEEAGQKLALVGGIGILVTMSFAMFTGIVSDKLRRRKPFVIGSVALTAIGLTLMAFADGFGLFFAAVLFVLGAAGMFGASDVAMASDLVPDREQAGRWMAIYNIAATLPSAIAPLIGSALLLLGDPAGGNYTALFLAGAVIALGTGFTTFFVRGIR
ncbi:Major Facilitator Superfamily protein [Agromyces sp. CF514]|uniref:MFS transporter n=1 Tax=Agromyces sp. CF514 TaxID=1881031 RepID=UPI0008F0348C|nr:MFS transporter [Agromyces sp. CF514]SFR78439.1 Major Facilitator Superfamily protein [Agromyces sp. CF514]